MNQKIAVLAGDGIGPEVMQQTLRVLECIAAMFNHRFEYLEADIGGQAYDACQSHCPEKTLQACESADAILFGSVGGPLTEQHQAKWKNCEVNSLLTLRKHFNLAINIRPIQVYPEFSTYCPLKTDLIKKGIHCVIFRELTGGIYFGRHHQSIDEEQRRIATDECVYREEQIERIGHTAFKAAQMRQQKLCSVDKANVLATSKLWREIMDEVSTHYSDVELTHMLVDNCAMQMIKNPDQFDVVVTENMFGDIISDLAAVLPGSLGLIPSASLGDKGVNLYEPSGGSAPELAGQDIANPCAQLLSAAMMLRYSFGLYTEAEFIEAAVRSTIANGIVTADLANDPASAASTTAFVDFMISHIMGDAIVETKSKQNTISQC